MEAKIFINYRREDTPWNSLLLYQELIKHFPEQNVFKDFNTIDPGFDFVEKIEEALDSCDVLLVLMGGQWLQIKDKKGSPRIFKEDDFVRLEIATALKRNIRVIPVLFDDAVLPTPEELPDDLKRLSRRQSIEIDKTRFKDDTARLVDAIKRSLPADPVTTTVNPPLADTLPFVPPPVSTTSGQRTKEQETVTGQTGTVSSPGEKNYTKPIVITLLVLVVAAIVYFSVSSRHSEYTGPADTSAMIPDDGNKNSTVNTSHPAISSGTSPTETNDDSKSQKKKVPSQTVVPSESNNQTPSVNTPEVNNTDSYQHFSNFPMAYIAVFGEANTDFIGIRGAAESGNTASVQNYKPLILIDDNSVEPSNIFPRGNEWAFRFVLEGNKESEPEKYQAIDNLIQNVFRKKGINFLKPSCLFGQVNFLHLPINIQALLSGSNLQELYLDKIILTKSLFITVKINREADLLNQSDK